MKLKFVLPLALAGSLAFAIVGASAGAQPAASPHVCSGTFMNPGVLKGTFKHGVTVKGFCAVNNGLATVTGTLTVTKNAALVAAFGAKGSRLVVKGDLVVDKKGTVELGCKATPEDACIDDPNPSSPTLSSRGTVSGSLIENAPFGVIVHNGAIGKDVTETGGGGGLTCTPPKKGFFGDTHTPFYSDYEDSSIGGNLTISGVKTCWIGVARDKVAGNTTVNSNDLADPDGIEIIANKFGNNLGCKGNTHPSGMPPGTKPVWDSAETDGGIYPRISEPNKVGGKRSGQCVKASPITLGGPPAAKHF